MRSLNWSWLLVKDATGEEMVREKSENFILNQNFEEKPDNIEIITLLISYQ